MIELINELCVKYDCKVECICYEISVKEDMQTGMAGSIFEYTLTVTPQQNGRVEQFASLQSSLSHDEW